MSGSMLLVGQALEEQGWELPLSTTQNTRRAEA
jgi:hypothetical protein